MWPMARTCIWPLSQPFALAAHRRRRRRARVKIDTAARARVRDATHMHIIICDVIYRFAIRSI